VPHYKKLVDLSSLDANGLRDYFEGLDNKNLQLENLKAEIEEKIEELVSKNKTRLKFMDRLKNLLSMYNNEAHDVEEIVRELIKFSKELDEEGQRGFKEGLEEEELAVFDLLLKDSLNPGEKEQVKKIAVEMLSKLKAENITRGWRDFEPTRSSVRKTIADYIYQLPDPEYSEVECEGLIVPVYNHIFEYFL
jgi:type I restriction enzyme, R subunit